MTISESRIAVPQLATTDISKVGSLTKSEKQELLNLQKMSHPYFTKEHIFKHTPYIENLYIYRMKVNETLVASRQFLVVNDTNSSPSWAKELNSSLNHQRFAVGSRAIVHPSLQGYGFGSALVKNVNESIFKNFNVDAIFGSSTNLRAIALYLKHNAEIWLPDLHGQFPGLTSLQMSAYDFIQDMKDELASRLHSPIRYYYASKYCSNNMKELSPNIAALHSTLNNNVIITSN